MEEIRFQKNKNSLIKMRAAYIITSLVSIGMIILGFQIQSNSTVFIFSGLLGLGTYFSIKSFSSTNTTIVNQKGIYNKVNGIGLISWEYIESFEIKKAVNTKVLVIKINDPETFLKTFNKVTKKLMESNIKKLGSPVVIPTSEFHEPLETVLLKLNSYKNSL